MTSILSESTVSNDEQQEVSTLVRQAYQLLAQNRVQQSISLYQKCIQQYPRCWRAYQNLGVAYIMQRQFDKANTALKTYVQHVPRDPLGHDSLGVSYSQLNDPLQAICSFVNSINLSPNYYMSYYNLGVVLGKLGLYDYALNVYLYCLQLQPNYINAMNNVADIYKKQNKINQAIEIFKEIIEIDPSYILAIKNLGNCYFAQQNYYQALITYFKVANVDSYHQSVLFNIALCLDYFQLFREAGNYAFKAHLKSSADKNQIVSAHRTFTAGTIHAKQMHSLNRTIRTYVRFRKDPPYQLLQRFYNSYLQTLGCFNIAKQCGLKYQQISQNMQRTKFNMIGYEVKMAQNNIIGQKNQHLDENQITQKMFQFLKQQQPLTSEILQWSKYTKRLLKKIDIKKDEQFQRQKQQLMKIFGKPQYHDVQSSRYRIKTYVSRRFNHNLKRLILKRHKFIKKYNRLNKKCIKLFKQKPMKITLTESQSIIDVVSDSK